MEKMGVIISLLLMAVAIMAPGGYASEVLDTDGNKVEVGELYYVVDKAIMDDLSEENIVTYASRSLDAPCPRVAVIPNYYISPLPIVPVKFFPDYKSNNITESFPLSIKFEVSYWPCLSQKTTFWTVNNRSTVTPYSEQNTIEPEGDGYKFVPVDSGTGNVSVIGVQSVQQSGFKRLVLLDESKPFVVVFKNASKLFKRSSLLSMVPFYNFFK